MFEQATDEFFDKFIKVSTDDLPMPDCSLTLSFLGLLGGKIKESLAPVGFKEGGETTQGATRVHAGRMLALTLDFLELLGGKVKDSLAPVGVKGGGEVMQGKASVRERLVITLGLQGSWGEGQDWPMGGFHTLPANVSLWSFLPPVLQTCWCMPSRTGTWVCGLWA